MAGGDDSWASLMQSRTVRIFLNGLCAVICGSHAIDAVRELMAGGSAALIEQIGPTAYYALTIVRLAVCLWVAVVFGRMTYQALLDQDKK